MEQEIKISVIVVTYNQERTIARTLDSILSQEIDVAYEIVIGDDCSSDGTEEICRKYASRYPDKIRYYRREENLGLVRNYFQCIVDSRGEFLADCAGDDFWVDKRKLQKEYDIILDNPVVALVHTGWICCDIDGGNTRPSEIFRGIPRESRQSYPKGSIVGRLLRNDPSTMIHLCTSMYRRDLIVKAYAANPELFVSSEYTCEDLQIVVTMAAMGEIIFIPDITLCYSVSNDSISHHTDFRKKFLQLRGELLLNDGLRRHYGISKREMCDYYRTKLDYMLAQVFHSGESDLWNQYLKIKENLSIEGSYGVKLILKELIIRNRLLWRICRKIFRKDKSL